MFFFDCLPYRFIASHIHKMTSDKMDIEVAEQKLKAMDHSEQHYFNRWVPPLSHALAASRR